MSWVYVNTYANFIIVTKLSFLMCYPKLFSNKPILFWTTDVFFIVQKT